MLSQALAEKKITPLQYKQLMQYLGKNPEFSQYEKALQSIIQKGEFDNLIAFFEAGLTEELIQIIKVGLTEDLI